jgi:hypothetical protein
MKKEMYDRNNSVGKGKEKFEKERLKYENWEW